MSKPELCRFAKTHEWACLEKGVVQVGLSDHAQKEITDVVFVEPPKIGRKVKRGESCAVVESVKAAFDVYAPISGEVVAANQNLLGDPGLVNRDPHGAGWIFDLRPDNPAEISDLMDLKSYAGFLTASAAHENH
ncbi:MAG: glycine cleavage system protein GcvH [Elusimicrobiota bacterium]